jgi:hypothetical protein
MNNIRNHYTICPLSGRITCPVQFKLIGEISSRYNGCKIPVWGRQCVDVKKCIRSATDHVMIPFDIDSVGCRMFIPYQLTTAATLL